MADIFPAHPAGSTVGVRSGAVLGFGAQDELSSSRYFALTATVNAGDTIQVTGYCHLFEGASEGVRVRHQTTELGYIAYVGRFELSVVAGQTSNSLRFDMSASESGDSNILLSIESVNHIPA